jgi:hypothetical protein
MTLISVPAVYDGNVIRLLETPPVSGSHRVIVTFIDVGTDLSRFWDSLGAWQDERPVEETLRDIHAARRSRATPPGL